MTASVILPCETMMALTLLVFCCFNDFFRLCIGRREDAFEAILIEQIYRGAINPTARDQNFLLSSAHLYVSVIRIFSIFRIHKIR